MPRLFQYQQIAQPPFDTSSPPPEVVTQDKWHPRQNTPESHWQKAAQFSLAAAVATSVFVPVPSQLNNPGGTQNHHTASTVAMTSVVQMQYQSLFAPIQAPAAAPEDITPDKWTGNIFQLPRLIRPHEQAPFDISFEGGPEATRLDKWFKETERPTLPPRRVAIFESFFFDSKPFVTIEDVTADKWFGSRPDILPRRPFLLVSSPIAFRASLETVNMDKWFREAAQPLFDHKRNQHTYPTFFIDLAQLTQAETITRDKWSPQYPDIVFDRARLQYTYPTNWIPATALQLQETVFPDRWLGRYPDVIFDHARNQFTYPTFFPDTFSLTQGELITLEKWFRETATPPKAAPRVAYFREGFFDPYPLPFTEDLTLDKWYRETQTPPKGQPILIYSFPATFWNTDTPAAAPEEGLFSIVFFFD